MDERNLVTILESLAKVIRDQETTIYIKDHKIKDLEAEIKELKEIMRNA
jgi:hypothetical protein